MAEKRELRDYIRKSTSLKDMLMSRDFAHTLQKLADSSLLYHKFRKIPVKLEWNESKDAEVAYINDKQCVINMASPLDTGKGFKERKALAIGKLAHEVFGHGLHTDFAIHNKIIDKMLKDDFAVEKYFLLATNYDENKLNEMKDVFHKGKSIADEPKEGNVAFCKTFQHVQNIIEDPCIEYLALQIYPGLERYVEMLRLALVKDLTAHTDQVDILGGLLMQARKCITPDVIQRFPALNKTQVVFDNIKNYPVYEDRLVATAYTMFEIWDDIKPDIEQATQNQQALKQFLQKLSEMLGMTSNNDGRTQNGQNNAQKQKDGQSGAGSVIIKRIAKQSNGSSNGNGDKKSDKEKDGNSNGQNEQSEKQQDGSGNSNGAQGGSDQTGNSGNGQGSKSDENGDTDKNGSNGERVDMMDASYSSQGSTGQMGGHIDRYNHSDDEGTPTGSDMGEGLDQSDPSAAFDRLADESTTEFIDRMAAEAIKNDKSRVEKKFEESVIEEEVYRSDMHKGYPYHVHKKNDMHKDLYNKVCEGTTMKAIAHALATKIIKAVRTRQKGNVLYEQDEGEMVDIDAYARGSDKCFMSIHHPNKKPVMAVSAMIDQSGSMSGERIDAARDAVIVLERFCRELKIPMHVYGHEDSGGVHIYNYVEHSDAPTPQRGYKLANLQTGGCNRDGFAIRYGLARLIKRPEQTKLMFIISDGAPNSSGYGHRQAIADVKDIKNICRKKGVTLIALAIGDDLDALREIYGANLVDARNLQDLPKNVTQMLLKQLKRVI